jgi:ascorbate-specific PTS system EIIC-type component UlaA
VILTFIKFLVVLILLDRNWNPDTKIFLTGTVIFVFSAFVSQLLYRNFIFSRNGSIWV